MDSKMLRKPARLKMVFTRPVFVVSLLVAAITTLAVWLLGLGTHRTLYVNSLLSVSLLSFFFLLYIVSGLYRGIKLKDNVGKITDRFPQKRFRGLRDIDGMPDGCIGELDDALAWLVAAIAAIVLIWLLGNVLWVLILVFAAMLYWIFFRAMRLIFKKSPVCRGNWPKSIGYGLLYTGLYNFWIYGIIMGARFLIH
jgi:hypothetical protein